MKPLKLVIENFKSHSFTEIDCTQFNSILIVARDLDDSKKSMGVGKSNIFKAIKYVLFGEADVKLDKVIRNGTNKCSVSFEFQIGDKIYKIVRSRFRNSKSDLRLFENNNGFYEDLSQKTVTETENELNKIIKISSTSFDNSIFFGQADLAGLASSSPKERKSLLKEPLNLAVYNKYEKLAKEKTSLSNKIVDKLKYSIELIGNPEKDIEEYNKQKEIICLSQNNLLLNLNISNIEKEFCADNLKKLKETYSEVNIKDMIERYDNICKSKKQLETKKDILSKSIVENEAKINNLLSDLNKNRTLLTKLKDNKKELTNRSFRNKIDVKKDLSKMIDKEIEGKSCIASLQNDKIKYSKSLPEGDSCDKCLQIITKEHKGSCEEKRKKELILIDSDIKQYTDTLGKVLTRKQQYELELANVESVENNIITINNKLSLKQSEVEQNTQLLKNLQDSLELRRTELNNLIKELDLILKPESELKEKIIESKKSSLSDKVKTEEDKLNIINLNLQKINKEINDNNISIGMFEEKIIIKTKDNDKLKQLKKELFLAEKELSVRQKVQQSFGSSGIPTMIISTILDDLQIVTNDLLTKIRPGLEILFLISKTKSDGQQEDTLDILYKLNGLELDFDQMSGGQKAIISLCLRIALSTILQKRIGVDLRFILFDECDASFDEATIEIFIDLIKLLQEKYTVFVISHNATVKNSFSSAILLEGNEINGTTGKLVTSW